MSTRDTPKPPVPFGKVERFNNSYRHVTIEISSDLEKPLFTSAMAITDKFLDEVRVRASNTDETITTDSDFWHFSVPYINGISFPMVWWPLQPPPEEEWKTD